MNTIPVTTSEPVPDISTISAIPPEIPKKKNYLPWILGILGLVIIIVVTLLIYVGISKSTPVPPERTAVDSTNVDMSTWKTYINEVRGFEFKYPNNLEIKSDMGMDYSDDSIYLHSKSERLPYCGVQSVSKKLVAEDEYFDKVSSLKDLIDNSYKQATENQNTLKRVVQPVQEGIFAGKKMYKYVVEEEGIDMIWGSGVKELSVYSVLAIEHNDSYIMIGCGDSNIYRQILSSFKFIDTATNKINLILPTDWTKSVEQAISPFDETDKYERIIVVKENYKIEIGDPVGGGRANCDAEIPAPSILNSPSLSSMVKRTNPKNSSEATNLQICSNFVSKDQLDYGTKIGFIKYVLPVNWDQMILKEMDSIVESIIAK